MGRGTGARAVRARSSVKARQGTAPAHRLLGALDFGAARDVRRPQAACGLAAVAFSNENLNKE